MELKAEQFKLFFPLPVTLITTVDSNGVYNGAPYSCVMPILRPSNFIAIASALPRDTLRNIRETREFVVNVIGQPAFREAMLCAKSYPPGVDEMKEVGLETVPSRTVSPPRMKEALGWIESVLEHEVVGENYSVVIGKVLSAEVNDAYWEDGKLIEDPLVMLMPRFRTLGEKLAKGEDFRGKPGH
jgi:flavin reductase (DIM6/NTAB) family NADH-FMN oxidoreductase RutF